MYGTFDRSSRISAMSAVSMETSLPKTPMAIPTFALARAGASLTPSPTIATLPYFSFRCEISSNLSSGRSSAW